MLHLVDNRHPRWGFLLLVCLLAFQGHFLARCHGQSESETEADAEAGGTPGPGPRASPPPLTEAQKEFERLATLPLIGTLISGAITFVIEARYFPGGLSSNARFFTILAGALISGLVPVYYRELGDFGRWTWTPDRGFRMANPDLTATTW